MVYIQLERRPLLALCYWSAGTNLVVLTTEKLYFFSFFFFLFLWFLLGRIFASLLSLTHSPPSLAPDKRERPFVLLQTICSLDYSRVLGLQKVRAALWSERLCTDWRSSVMETLVVILNCRWQVKRLKVPFNSVWKENIVFSAKKNK